MAHRTSRVIHRKIAIAAAIGLALGLGPAAAAHADDPTVAFKAPTSVTIEYGEYWDFTLEASHMMVDDSTQIQIDIDGAPSAFKAATGYYDQSNVVTIIWVTPPDNARALPAGNYSVKASVTDSGQPPVSAAPATLVVKPAALGIELRVLPDSSNPTGAIVSARFTGKFVEQYQSSFAEGAALSPAGEWHITLKDSQGEVAIERNFERAAGDDVLATSFYWDEAKPDEEYSATAEFVPSGASATNFTIASATTFTYTAQQDPRPVPSSTATAKPAADLPEPAGFSLPPWALIVGGVLILGLGALVTVLSIRLSKRPALVSTEAVVQ